MANNFGTIGFPFRLVGSVRPPLPSDHLNWRGRFWYTFRQPLRNGKLRAARVAFGSLAAWLHRSGEKAADKPAVSCVGQSAVRCRGVALSPRRLRVWTARDRQCLTNTYASSDTQNSGQRKPATRRAISPSGSCVASWRATRTKTPRFGLTERRDEADLSISAYRPTRNDADAEGRRGEWPDMAVVRAQRVSSATIASTEPKSCS